LILSANILESQDPSYFDEQEIISRRSQYENNFDVRSFIYETPFTKDGGKAYTEDMSKQWKRKTIIKLAKSLPFCYKSCGI